MSENIAERDAKIERMTKHVAELKEQYNKEKIEHEETTVKY